MPVRQPPPATSVPPGAIEPQLVPSQRTDLGCRMLADGASHVMPGTQEEAAEKIDAGLRAALAG